MKLCTTEFMPGDMLTCCEPHDSFGPDRWIFADAPDRSKYSNIFITVIRTIITYGVCSVITLDGQTFYCVNNDNYDCVKRL